MNLAEKAKKHTAEMAVRYAEEINSAVANSVIYRDDSLPPLPANPNHSTKLGVFDETSTRQIYENALSDHKIAVLNFASYVQPGGEFLTGSIAQEECLCHESFLYNVLSRMTDFYATNNENLNYGLYRNAAIYTPGVIFENSEHSLKNIGDVITCAAPNNRAFLHEFDRSDASMNHVALVSRIGFILHVAAVNHVETLILGAFGCGAFGQDATEVATIFKYLLENNFKGYFQRVAFSIPKDGKFCNLQKFQRVFPSYEVRRNRVYWSMDPEDFISMLSFICASAGMDLTGYIQDLNYRLAIGALDEKDAKKYLLEQVKKDSNSPAALAADVMMNFDETDERYIQIFYRKAE